MLRSSARHPRHRHGRGRRYLWRGGAYPPFSWTDASGEIKGFDIDLANALCQQMAVRCELVAQDWDGMILALLSRKYDAIIAAMSITDERRKKVDFTEKYAHIPNRFVAARAPN